MSEESGEHGYRRLKIYISIASLLISGINKFYQTDYFNILKIELQYPQQY